MPHTFLIFCQSNYLIQIVDINSHTEWKTVQIQISWLLQKPTDLDLHCLQRQDISGFSRTRVKSFSYVSKYFYKLNQFNIILFFKSVGSPSRSCDWSVVCLRCRTASRGDKKLRDRTFPCLHLVINPFIPAVR